MNDKKTNMISNIKTTIVAVLLVALVLFYFNYLSNKSADRRTDKQMTEVESLMNYDMLGDYPKTPRDVVKLHNRFFKQFYGQKLSDDELKILNHKIRNLYCTELLALNPEDVMYESLKDNIDEMKKSGYEYKSYELPEASQVKKYMADDREMATLEVTVAVNTDDSKGYMYIQYILIKENDQWKIYGWGDSKLGDRQ